MRVLVLSIDPNTFVEGSAVARRFRLQASTVVRLDVLVPHGPGALVQLAGNAAARGFGLGKIGGFFRALAAGWRVERPDIVSVQDPFLIGFLGWAIALMRGSKFHVQVHTDVFDPGFAAHSFANRLKVLLARFIFARADSIRVVSERAKKSLLARGIRAEVSVLPVFIDTAAAERAVPFNRRHRYPQFEKLVLFVGRLEPEKNAARALRVMAEIIKEEPRAGMIVLGGGSQLAYLESLSRELEISKQVVFEPYQDPFPFYKAADLLLVTSQYEGYGMAVVEALLSGCPVVSPDVGVAGEMGALVSSFDDMPAAALQVLRSGARGRLAVSLPSESEYRDLWHAQMVQHLRGETPRSAPAEEETPPRVGFVGQGWIGKNYADELQKRGVSVVRYALEEPYRANKALIQDCDIVFIAVPTPTTQDGFDDSYVKSALLAVGDGKTAVIKSTILPGTTQKLQALNPGKFILHSPEFLAEATASYDAAHPTRNIVGIPSESPDMRLRAEQVLRLLPPASFELICSSVESELIKYVNNVMLAMKVVQVNLVYDLAARLGADYAVLRDAIGADPRIGRSHLDPVHKSGHKNAKPGRGAGGDCFIKDFEAFRRLYAKAVGDMQGNALLDATVEKNISLLLNSGKDAELLQSVYGKKQ